MKLIISCACRFQDARMTSLQRALTRGSRKHASCTAWHPQCRSLGRCRGFVNSAVALRTQTSLTGPTGMLAVQRYPHNRPYVCAPRSRLHRCVDVAMLNRLGCILYPCVMQELSYEAQDPQPAPAEQTGRRDDGQVRQCLMTWESGHKKRHAPQLLI